MRQSMLDEVSKVQRGCAHVPEQLGTDYPQLAGG